MLQLASANVAGAFTVDSDFEPSICALRCLAERIGTAVRPRPDAYVPLFLGWPCVKRKVGGAVLGCFHLIFHDFFTWPLMVSGSSL